MAEVATFSAIVFMLNMCANGDYMDSKNKCTDNSNPTTIEFNILSGHGICEFNASDDCSSKTDSLATLKENGKIISQIPTTSISAAALKFIWMNVNDTLNRLNECHDDAKSICISREKLKELRGYIQDK